VPFASQAQRRFLYARHPRIAARWQRHTPKGANLPERVSTMERKRKTPPRSAHSRGHPGFKAVQARIARRQGIGAKRAGAILAAATRGASPAAKRRNPRLKRVKG